MADRINVKTPLCRVAFSRGLFKPQASQSGKVQYSCSLLFDKGLDIGVLRNAALEAATAEWGEKARQLIEAGAIRSPFLDGDSAQGRSKTTGEPHAGFPHTTFLRVTSGVDYPPRVLGRNMETLTSDRELYSGCYAYALVNPYTWETREQGRGISFGVSTVQFVRDGEPLGGNGAMVDPSQHFSKIPDEGDAPAAVQGGAGAKALFG